MWRPFEPSRDEAERIEAEREANTCNLHEDCAAADREVQAQGGRPARCDGWADGKLVKAGQPVFSAFHCHIDGCEDCFGC